MWKCGEPYKYPIPKEDGNPWEKLLQSLLKRDRDQCDSWKDEVENLLIFAGLFSAVVTAFVTQSYKGLRPDPNDSVIFLLSQIVAHLDNGLNNTSARALATSPLQIPLSPTPPSTFRVNALWFISLVLSLTTVLVGIVSLQWLREHLRYPVQIDPKEQFALFHMRSEGLEKWYIPEIFSLLPLLLQAALALFLVGLVDFLLALGHRVAIPVIVVIAVPIIFLIATTSLPTLQAFSLSLPLRDSVPAQCPYKSPQSRLFRRLASLTGTTFRACAALFIGFHFLIVRLPLIIFQNIKNSKSGPRFRQYLYHSRHFDYKIWHLNTWLLFDKAWLDIRDRYSVRLYRQPNKPTEDTPVPFDVFSFGPLYDLTHGLRKVRHETRLANAQFTLYRCVEELTSSIVDQNTILTVPNSPENVAWIFHQNQYLQALLGYEVSLFDRVRAFSHLLAQPNIKILHDENLLLFFSTYGYSWQSAEIKRHVAELYTRLMVYCYASGPHKLDPAIFDVSRKEFYAVGLLSLRRKLHLFHIDPMYLDPEKADIKAFSEPYTLILESIFNFAADQCLEDNDIMESFHAHWYLQILMALAVENQSEDAAVQTLEFITVNINEYFLGGREKRPDLLFYIASIYVKSVFELKFQGGLRYAATETLPLLRRYQQHIGIDNVVLERRLDIGNFSDGHIQYWGFLTQPDAQDDDWQMARTTRSLETPERQQSVDSIGNADTASRLYTSLGVSVLKDDKPSLPALRSADTDHPRAPSIRSFQDKENPISPVSPKGDNAV